MTDSLGTETYIIYLCNGSIAVYDNASDVYTLYHGYYDAQGSLIALTDDSGHVLARYAYDPAVAQFLSPDPYIQDGGNWLNYNHYTSLSLAIVF